MYTYSLALCECCAVTLARGECCDEHGGDPTPLNKIPVDSVIALGPLGGEESEQESYFSVHPCDGCGRPGGTRLDATGWMNINLDRLAAE